VRDSESSLLRGLGARVHPRIIDGLLQNKLNFCINLRVCSGIMRNSRCAALYQQSQLPLKGQMRGFFRVHRGYCAALCSNDRISGRARFACLI
jgi:hypothetical protein